MRYFFHVRTTGGIAFDHEGQECNSAAQACVEAILIASELGAEFASDDPWVVPKSVEVIADDGHHVSSTAIEPNLQS